MSDRPLEVDMGSHSETDEERVFVVEQQAVRVEDAFRDEDLILDLGGGGEGVIGQLRGRQVVAVDRRKDELEECADGPIKVVADAKALPFLDEAFDVAAAFFFLMYVPNEDRLTVLREARRVLKPGGALHVWDVTIPPRADRPEETFAVFVKAELPDRVIETGYGVPWASREMSASSIAEIAREAGFDVEEAVETSQTFRLRLRRPTE